MATLIKIDRNGTKHYEGQVECDRCGGAGRADKWMFTGYTCYKCGGSGKMQGRYKVYTPEYEAKLEAKRQARLAKWEDEHRKEIEERERKAEEARLEQEKREAEEKARKAISQYVGQVGEKIEVKVTYEHTAWFERKCFGGYGTETVYIHNFKDENGNVITWKTTSKGDLGIEEGAKVVITGQVKAHEEYKDEKQTHVIRLKIKEVA